MYSVIFRTRYEIHV